jgi:tRNA (cytidine/uridine-2'-O-)-methyltransferase
MRLALYQPDIPQNTGTILRLGACLGVPVDIIGPAGFDLRDKALRRAGLDYLDFAVMTLHPSWQAYLAGRDGRRIVLLTTAAETPHHAFPFAAGDTLLLGRESAGVPDAVHASAGARIRIPMRGSLRSLNVAVAAAIGLGEALRQTAGWPKADP